MLGANEGKRLCACSHQTKLEVEFVCPGNHVLFISKRLNAFQIFPSWKVALEIEIGTLSSIWGGCVFLRREGCKTRMKRIFQTNGSSPNSMQEQRRRGMEVEVWLDCINGG